MNRQFAIALTAFLLVSAPGGAQVAGGPTPGIGTTSPLGTLNPLAPIGGSGIPLGSTELSVGGVSPVPNAAGTACSIASGEASTSTGVFDGGGLAGGCIATGSSVGSGSLAGSAPTTSANGLAGVNIPLGSTEINSAGVAGPLTVPMPNVTTSSACSGMNNNPLAATSATVPALFPSSC